MISTRMMKELPLGFQYELLIFFFCAAKKLLLQSKNGRKGLLSSLSSHYERDQTMLEDRAVQSCFLEANQA